MSDIENVTTAEATVGKDLIQEQVNLEKEQEELDGKKQADLEDKESETLLQKQEEINKKIEDFEKKREETREILEQFVQEFNDFIDVENKPSSSEQYEKLQNMDSYEKLPKSISSVIEENYEKFNFIDHKIAEVVLKEDLLGKEIEELKEEQEMLDDVIKKKVDVDKEKDGNESGKVYMGDLKEEIVDDIEEGGFNTDILGSGDIIDNNFEKAE